MNLSQTEPVRLMLSGIKSSAANAAFNLRAELSIGECYAD